MNRWYLSKGFVWAMLAIFGPLGLPLLWFSPHFSKQTKILITVVALVLTFLLARFTLILAQLLERELASLRQVQGGI